MHIVDLMTEAGSAVNHMRARLTADGDGYRLNAYKNYVTGGHKAAACLVWWQWAGGSWAPALTLAGAAVLAGGAVCVAWAKFGRKAVPAFTLLTAPLYIAWKLPIYLRLVARREKTWVRTDRGRLSDSGLA